MAAVPDDLQHEHDTYRDLYVERHKLNVREHKSAFFWGVIGVGSISVPEIFQTLQGYGLHWISILIAIGFPELERRRNPERREEINYEIGKISSCFNQRKLVIDGRADGTVYVYQKNW